MPELVRAEALLTGTTVVLLTLANLLPADDMAWSREALARGELWRLWTGPFSHWSTLHLAGNLAAATALSLLIGARAQRWIAVLPLAAPLLSLFLLVGAPTLQHYRGLSGLLGVLVVGAAVEGGGVGRLIAILYLAKLTFDAVEHLPSPLLPPDVTVAWQAHLAGVLLGLLTAAVFHLRRPTPPFPPPDRSASRTP